jgi:hypothetical protein
MLAWTMNGSSWVMATPSAGERRERATRLRLDYPLRGRGIHNQSGERMVDDLHDGGQPTLTVDSESTQSAIQLEIPA